MLFRSASPDAAIPEIRAIFLFGPVTPILPRRLLSPTSRGPVTLTITSQNTIFSAVVVIFLIESYKTLQSATDQPVAAPRSSSSSHQHCKIYVSCPYSPMRASAGLTFKRPSISQRTPCAGHSFPAGSGSTRCSCRSERRHTGAIGPAARHSPRTGQAPDSLLRRQLSVADASFPEANSPSHSLRVVSRCSTSPPQGLRWKNAAWTRRMCGCGT